MNILVFDCETTGLIPKQRKYNIDTYPYIVQLSWLCFNIDTNELNDYDTIIKQENIPKESSDIHGITTEYSLKHGQDINDVLNIFIQHWNKADMIVAHNLSFDLNMIQTECKRHNIQLEFKDKILYCTMKNSIDLCGIKKPSQFRPGSFYYKYPKLNETFKYLFPNETININKLHNSFVDIYLCFICFYKLYYDEDIRMKHSSIQNIFKKLLC